MPRTDRSLFRFVVLACLGAGVIYSLTAIAADSAPEPKPPETVTAGTGTYDGPSPEELAKIAAAQVRQEAEAEKLPEISTMTPADPPPAGDREMPATGVLQAPVRGIGADGVSLFTVGAPLEEKLPEVATQTEPGAGPAGLTATEIEKSILPGAASHPAFHKEPELAPPTGGAPQVLTPAEREKFGLGDSLPEVKP